MNWIQPMEPVSIPYVITEEGWFHEIKWDGIRGLVHFGENNLNVFTKKGNERTLFYPELTEIKSLIDAKSVVLDGEIIVLDDAGNPSFFSSLIRERVRDTKKVRYFSSMYPVKYVVFDILFLNGKDLTQLPLLERKNILHECLEKSSNITFTDSFSDGKKLFEFMREKNWEGIVSKRKDSRYISGKAHKLWYKSKLHKKMLTVVGGIQWKDNLPNSLLLGVYRMGVLEYVGKASIGLTQQDKSLLKDYYSYQEQKECPFSIARITDHRSNVSWLKPLLTCWAGFMEITDEGLLRQPRILGFSSSIAADAIGKVLIEGCIL